MNINMFPTKGNLIAAKNSLALARQGYDLMDKKRHREDSSSGKHCKDQDAKHNGY